MNKISSGSDIIDELIDGGYETEIITTIYGPAGSGKTNFCMLCAISVAKNKKVIYIDTEGSFSINRFIQLCDDKKILDNIIFLKPTSFQEQSKAIEKIKALTENNIGLIIIDTIAMLYRLEIGQTEDVYNVNRELGKQISFLNEISRKKNIPVLITNQVYANFDDKNKINMVGGDILKYASKCLIELQNGDGKRRAIIKKHRSLPEKMLDFVIVGKGIEKLNPG